MAGLMVVFMFILIAYIRPIIESRERVREIAVAWNESETQIYEALQSEFSVDLARWDAELDAQSLTLRFKAPDVLFNQASADIRPEFAIILDDFFPRYISILSQFSKSIEEIRIEGHTSSEWNVGASSSDAYFGNMALSQMRTRSVLAYALSTLKDSQLAEWAKAHATANGLSSSRLIRLTDGTEDRDRSRRVEFRVVTDTKRQIVRILESLEG
jgi:outer membrane protein OmpA-like peptidoglycan-associated protein